MIEWSRQGQTQQAQWRSEAGAPAPRRVVTADDTLPADTAYRMACEGTGLLWQGDFQNARHLLQALMRRTDSKTGKHRRSAAKAAQKAAVASPSEAFHLHRQAQAQRARVLASVLIPLEGDYSIALRRAPDWREACTQAWGPATGERSVATLRELLGLVGAYEWRKKGVEVPALGAAPNLRIDAVKATLARPQSARRSLLEIALECGFGSKSTFNAVFKKSTGLSPTAYRASLAEAGPPDC